METKTDIIDMGSYKINVHTTHYRCWNDACRDTKGRKYLCIHKQIDAPELKEKAAICPDCAGSNTCAVKYAQYKSPK